MKALMTRFFREEDGAAATEYAILVAAIAGVVGLAVTAFDMDGIFGTVKTKVTTAVNNA